MVDKYIDLSYNTRPGSVSATTVAYTIIGTVTGTNATPSVFTKTAHGLNSEDVVLAANFVENTALNDKYWVVDKIDANTFRLGGKAGQNGGTAETTGGYVYYHSPALISPTNQVRLYYDATVDTDKLVDAAQRAKEALTELLS